jgi:hypothetical protein
VGYPTNFSSVGGSSQWTTGASGFKISYPDTVHIGAFDAGNQEFLVTSDHGGGGYSQVHIDWNEATLYNITPSGSGGIVASSTITRVGDLNQVRAHLDFNTSGDNINIPLTTITFSGATTASDTDHYTTMGDVLNIIRDSATSILRDSVLQIMKDSVSHMIIEFTQTTTSAPTYVIRENTSPYTINSTAYSTIGNYTVDFDLIAGGDCGTCMDAGKYYIRTQIFWSASNSVPFSCFTYPALNSLYTLNLVMGDLTGTTYDDIGEPFSIEIVWYHEQ